jgi:hypothetical protein
MNLNVWQSHSPCRHFRPGFLGVWRASIDARVASPSYGLNPGLSVPFSVAIFSSVG